MCGTYISMTDYVSLLNNSCRSWLLSLSKIYHHISKLKYLNATLTQAYKTQLINYRTTGITIFGIPHYNIWNPTYWAASHQSSSESKETVAHIPNLE